MALGLNAIISSDPTPFVAGVQRADASIGTLGGSLGKIGGIIAGAFAVDRIVAFGKSVFDRVSDLDDLAANLGTTTGAIAGLQVASDMTGVSFDSAAALMLKLNKTLGDAVRDGGPAADALKMLGMNAADLAKQDKAAAFDAIKEGLAAIPNSADRASVGFAIFGKKVSDAYQLMDYSQKQATEEAKRFGLAISATDAAKLEESGRIVTRGWLAVKGAVAQALVAANGFVDFVLNSNPGIASSEATIADKFRAQAEIVDELNATLKERNAILEQGQKLIEASFTDTEKWQASLRALNEAYEKGGIDQGTYEKMFREKLKQNPDDKAEADAEKKKTDDGQKRLEGIERAADKWIAAVQTNEDIANNASQEIERLRGRGLPDDVADAAQAKVRSEYEEKARALEEKAQQEYDESPQIKAMKIEQDRQNALAQRIDDIQNGAMIDSMFPSSRMSGGRFGSTDDPTGALAMSRSSNAANWAKQQVDVLKQILKAIMDSDSEIAAQPMYDVRGV